MKRLCYTIALTLQTAQTFSQNPYIREDSIGTTPKPQTVNRSDPFTPLPTEAWVGEKFVFMPMSDLYSREGYIVQRTATSDISYIPYARYKGRIATVLHVARDVRYRDKHIILFQVDDTRERFLASDFLGYVRGWASKRDIDYSRANFIGKTLWLRNREASSYDSTTRATESFKVKNLQPVKVLDVVLSDSESWPLRFILQSADGQQFIKVAALSGTNAQPSSADAYRFEDMFFTEDPRGKYAWDKATFTAIEDGRLLVGMTKEQAIMSWGKPLKVNRTLRAGASIEQWVYGGRRYVYFDGNKLTTIQD